MYNVIIWGAGESGNYTYRALEHHRNYRVIAFGDNDSNLQGKKKYNLPIVSAEQKDYIELCDLIVIASVHFLEIYNQLSQVTTIPIYKSIDEIMYTKVSVDISGYCNAKCRWCVTGGGYNNKRLNECYMHYKEFVKLYEHLYDNKIIEKSTILMLYNWGEPLLNKDYVQIIEFLAEKGQRFSISTNASKVELVHKKSAYKNCDSFTFSMSGFSQESYNRIHGFSFEKIKKNILELNKNIKENGFCGDGSISFHVYKFNKCEIQEAKKFADSLQLRFNPYYPYFNGNSMMQAYLENTMQKNKKDLAEEELYLSHVKDIISARPENYECCIKDIITINSEGILTLCCASDDACSNFKWGSAYNIKSFEQMKKKREEMLVSDTCAKCRQLGMDYWIDKNPSYEIK